MQIAYTDEDIIQMLQSGEQRQEDKAFTFLYRTHFDNIQKWLGNKGFPTTVEASDIFQPALMDLFYMTKADGFELKATASLKSILYTICNNRWKNEWRGHHRQVKLKVESPEEKITSQSVLVDIVNNEKKIIVAQLLSRMGSRCQKLLQLFFYKKMQHEDIADEMKFKTAQQSRNAVSNCKKKLLVLITEKPEWKQLLH